MLERRGFLVVEASGDGATFDVARVVQPDIAVVDLTLPETDAFALLTTLRCALPSVLLLATADFLPYILLPTALKLGAHDTFDKSLGDKLFGLKIRRLMSSLHGRRLEVVSL